MTPMVLVETTNSVDIQSVYATIQKTNDKLIKKSEAGKTKAADYKEMVFEVGKLDVDIADCLFNLYDIPGLNDARTKKVYYDYLAATFDKFNVVIFIVDLQSGLNTSDEMDILNFIVKHTTEFKHRNVRTLVVANKADDMQLSEDCTLTFKGELLDMYQQVQQTVTQAFSKIPTHLLGVVPLCALDAYLYRSIRKHGAAFKLTPEQIQKIGMNDQGKKFSKLSESEQYTKVAEIVKDTKFIDDMILLSGFSQFEKKLADHLKTSHKGDRIGNIMARFDPTDVDTEIQALVDRFGYETTAFIEVQNGEILHSVKRRVDMYKTQIKPIDTVSYHRHMMELINVLQKYIPPRLKFPKWDYGTNPLRIPSSVSMHPLRHTPSAIEDCPVTLSIMQIDLWLASYNGFRNLIVSLGIDIDFGDQDFYTTPKRRALYPDYDRENVWRLLKPSFPHHKCAFGLKYCVYVLETIGYLDAPHLRELVQGFFNPCLVSYDPTLPVKMDKPPDMNATCTIKQLKRLAPFLSKEENERVARYVIVAYFKNKTDMTSYEVTVRRMMYARRNETCVRLLLDMLKVVDYETIIKGWDSEYEKDPRFELDLYYLQTLETVVDLMA
jgi:hypothetical protein